VALTQFFARGARQVPDGGDWFEKTTTFADRENNDPLAPVRKELRAAKAPESRMVGVERESNNWYKNQEKKRSMFGRTLNPLTGYAPACVCVSMRGSSVGAPFLCLAPCSHRAALPRCRACDCLQTIQGSCGKPSQEAVVYGAAGVGLCRRKGTRVLLRRRDAAPAVCRFSCAIRELLCQSKPPCVAGNCRTLMRPAARR